MRRCRSKNGSLAIRENHNHIGMENKKLQAHSAIFLANTIFGLGVPVTKLLLDEWVTPMGYMASRSLGACLVFLAGLLKAVWKMQNAVGAAPVELFNKGFFPTQSIGFLLMAVGMLALTYGKRKSARSLTMVWVMLTVLGNLGASAGLVWIASKVKKAAVPLFIVAFVFSMMMGYLSSRDFAQASMHWIAQSVNTLGQGLLLVGTLMVHKAGLVAPDALGRKA